MKKIFFIIVIIIGGILISIAFAFFALILALIAFPIGFLIDLFLLLCFIVGMIYINKLCKDNFKIGITKFTIYSELPSAILSILLFIFLNYLDSCNYWQGEFFGGLFEFLLSFSWLICSILILVVTIIVHIIIYALNKRKNGNLNKNEQCK